MSLAGPTPPPNPYYTIDLPVLETCDGSVKVVRIPLLTQKGFDHLKLLLDMYKPAIVKDAALKAEAGE